MARLAIFSFFSGSGFLDLGFETNGFDIEFVNEYSSSFMRAYKYSREIMHLRKPKYGYHNCDINIFLKDHDELANYIDDARKKFCLIGFIGGPPCPDFSVAGRQKGRNGDNGKLSQSYVDAITYYMPDFFLFENVKGLWKTAKHREFYEELKEQLQKAGFVTTERLTNSLEYGVPQDRDRILLFGIQKKYLGEKSLDDFPWTKYKSKDLAEIKAMPWPKMDEFEKDGKREMPDGIDESLTVEYIFRKNDVENHPNAKDYFIPRQGLEKMRVIPEGDDHKKSYKRLHRWRYSPTAAYGNNEVHLHPYKERRISVAEALAIQSLPKEFCLPQDMSLTDKFKTVGNGVPYLLSSGIAKTIFDFLEELTCSE